MRKKQFSDNDRSLSVESNYHPGCTGNILQIIRYHHWRHAKKTFTHLRRAGGRHLLAAGVGNPGKDTNDYSHKQNRADQMEHRIHGEKMTRYTPAPKSSVKARIKAMISEEMYRKKGRHHRSSTFPARSHLRRIDSIHHLEPLDIMDPLTDMVSDIGSPVTFQQKHDPSSATSSTLDSLPLVCFEDPITSDNGYDQERGNMFMGEYRENNQIDEYDQKLVTENNTHFVAKMDSIEQDMLEKKLVHAEELNAEGLLHRKEFRDALDIINENKNLLLKVLNDPSSPLAQHFHNQQALSAKIGLNKWGSFPLPGSSGRSKEKGKLQIGSQSQKSMPSKVENDVDGNLKPNTKTGEIRENQIVIKRYKDVKQKIQHFIKESRKERHRIAMDSVLHKIPHGKGFPNEWEKEILSQLKDPVVNREGKGSPESSYEDDYDVASLRKFKIRHIRRTSSLKESVDRYCRLYETSFNRESKQQISESSNLTTGERPSPSESATKSLSRVHSLPDLKSYIYQSGDSSGAFSSGMMSRAFDKQSRLDLPVDLGNELHSDTLVGSKIEEKVGENNSCISDEVGSTPIANNEANAKVGFDVDDFGNLTARDIASCNEDIKEDFGRIKEPIASLEELIPDSLPGFSFVEDTTCPEQSSIAEDIGSMKEPIASLEELIPDSLPGFSFVEDTTCPEQSSIAEDIGSMKEPIAKLEELIPAPLPDSNFINDTTSPEQFSLGEDSKLKARNSYRPDNLANQRHVSGMDTSEVAAGGVELEEVEPFNTPSDPKTLHLEVDAKDKAEFNYVRDVLELSGFSGNESLATWHSEDQPVNPSVYEEVEGCLLPDAEFSGKEVGNCSHPLLFDLINEVLMEMFGRSYSYCPKLLSPLSHIRPIPSGHHVLEEVWTLMSWYLSSRPGSDQSLDYSVSRDLSKSDWWMNLQFDTECVGLELEDLIFEDLLEEVF
ncbi:uncharacterized protein LOC122275555 [Carya illinoinensis]|uniref:uncharacterized protein LOC122275555 n=1 Tax=Carya illinoinensis TaxID=32201 RepID=UPI001C722B6F|nr:uncharacterized protein LOC122275555 [Carya illinoinensis]